MDNNNKRWLQSFIEQHSWSIILLVGGLIIIYANTSNRVNANEEYINRISSEVDRLTALVERVVILEEHDKVFAEDLAEIKVDVKTLLRQTR